MSTDYFRTDAGEFQCRHCEKLCAKQNTMYYHVQSKHSQECKFACSHCPDKKFIQKSTYLQHMASVHPDDTDCATKNPYVGVSFTCPFPECGQTAKTKANILVHFARSHCKDWIPAFAKACKHCEKPFASSTAYFYHASTCCPPPANFQEMLQKMK